MISIIPLYNDSFQGGFDLCKLGQFHASTALLGDGCPRRRDGPTSCQGCLKLNALHYGRGWNRARFPATIPAFGLKLLPNMWTHWSDIFCHVLSPMKLEVIKNIIPVCWRAWYMVYPLAQTNIGDGFTPWIPWTTMHFECPSASPSKLSWRVQFQCIFHPSSAAPSKEHVSEPLLSAITYHKKKHNK